MERFVAVAERLAQTASTRPWRTLAALGVVTLVLTGGVTRLEIATDGAAVYPLSNRVIEDTRADRVEFDDPQLVILLLTSAPGGPEIDSREGLRYLKQLHHDLGKVDGVVAQRVRSLVTLLDGRPEDGLFEIPGFLDSFAEDKEAFQGMLQRLHAFPLTHGLFLAQDGRAAALYAPAASGVDRLDLLARIEGWSNAHADPRFELRLLGPVVAEATLGKKLLIDLLKMVPAVVVLIAVLLFISLRSVFAVLIPIAEILLVMVWTLGLMGYLGVPITLVTMILPVVLMTMAVTDEVHLLERLQAHLRNLDNRGASRYSEAEVQTAMRYAVADVGAPIVLTSLTTAIGLLSFLSASIQPIRDFGLFCAVGILFAMVHTFSFVPALARLLPPRWLREFRRSRLPSVRTPPTRQFTSRSPGLVLLGFFVFLTAIPGVTMLIVEDSWIANLDPESAMVRAEREFNRRFWGSYRYDIVLSSSVRRQLERPAGLAAIEKLRDVARAGPFAGGVVTHLLPIEEMARLRNVTDPVPISA
ncbi:MAG: MMPL family transporter, partial [Gammaproteobacteria bacterium]|nr:MMPL family transporter [Gammaproteobacteria bacterium]